MNHVARAVRPIYSVFESELWEARWYCSEHQRWIVRRYHNRRRAERAGTPVYCNGKAQSVPEAQARL